MTRTIRQQWVHNIRNTRKFYVCNPRTGMYVLRSCPLFTRACDRDRKNFPVNIDFSVPYRRAWNSKQRYTCSNLSSEKASRMSTKINVTSLNKHFTSSSTRSFQLGTLKPSHLSESVSKKKYFQLYKFN